MSQIMFVNKYINTYKSISESIFISLICHELNWKTYTILDAQKNIYTK